jgi:signal transduction histidine kinase
MGILSLCVRDDGRGFDMPLEDPQKGLGFFGMRERVHAAGGHLDIESAPGKGTTISIILPVKGELHQ